MLVGGGGVQQHRFAETMELCLVSRRPYSSSSGVLTRRTAGSSGDYRPHIVRGHGGRCRRSHLALASLPGVDAGRGLAFFSAIACLALDGLGARPPATRCS